MKTLAQRLIAAREARGWSQAELSEASGGVVGQRAISHIEKGESNGRRKTIEALAAALGVSTAYLMVGKTDPQSDGIPIDGSIAAHGQAIGERLTQVMQPGALYRAAPDAFSFSNRVTVTGSHPSWWVSKVDASMERGGPSAGDWLVLAPGAKARPGDWLIATSDTDAYHERIDAHTYPPETRLRALREIDGQLWLWPLSEGDRPAQMTPIWSIVAVVVQHWRRPDLHQLG